MIRLEGLPPQLVTRVLAEDAAAMKAMVRTLDPIVPKELRSDQSESAFATEVRKVARIRHYWSYHTQFSKWSEKGLPDWLFVRGQRIVWAELKTDWTTITPHQARVITILRNAGAEVHIWRPATGLDVIGEVLA